jgi:hypothetical protein
MKKIVVCFFILFQLITNGQENQSIPQNVKDELLTMMVPHLRSFVEKWGTYIPGTSITEINQIESNKIEIRGKVNYEGDQCGRVNADYKFLVVSEGDENNFEICVKCPYCFLGSILKYEWDCKGQKYMDAGDYLEIYGKLNAVQVR